MSRALKMLLEKGWITDAQYERAIVLSTRYGETPGYHLVNDGAIADEDLVDFFIRHFSLRYCPRHELKQVTKETLAAVSPVLAKHLRVFPVQLTDTALTLGMTDPSMTHAVEEISFHTQRFVEPVIVAETDMTWALAHYYDIHPVTPADRYSLRPAPPPSAAMISGVQTAEKKTPAKNTVSEAVTKTDPSKTVWGIDKWGVNDKDDALPTGSPDRFVTAASAHTATQSRTKPAPQQAIPFAKTAGKSPTQPRSGSRSSSRPPSIRHSIASMMQGIAPVEIETPAYEKPKITKPSTDDIRLPKEFIYQYQDVDELPQQNVSDLIGFIKKASHQDEVISYALDYLILIANRAAFLTVKKDEIRGFDIKGDQTNREAIKRYWIPRFADSTFKRTIDDRQIHIGPLIRTTSDAVFSAALGGRPRRVIIIPLEIKGRVIGLLYADKLKIEMPPFNLLERLADVVSGALLALILKKIKP